MGSQLTLCSLGGLLQLHEAASHLCSQLGSSLRTVCSTTDASELLLPGLLQGCMFPCPAIPRLTWGRLAQQLIGLSAMARLQASLRRAPA